LVAHCCNNDGRSGTNTGAHSTSAIAAKPASLKQKKTKQCESIALKFFLIRIAYSVGLAIYVFRFELLF
jgi:hypothetical protein